MDPKDVIKHDPKQHGSIPSSPFSPPPPQAHEAEVTFPQLLMDAIERETTRADGTLTVERERVFEWLPAGDSFVVRDTLAFEKKVLPKYFNKCKFLSFVRKLYRWGFHQDQKTTHVIKIFRSKHFVRGDRQRCLKMRSIVRSLPKYQPPPPSFTGYNTVHRGRFPPAVGGAISSQQQYGMPMGPPPHAIAQNDLTMATAHHPFPPQVPAPHLQMGRNDILNSSSLLQGGRPFSSLHIPNNQYLRSSVGTGMISLDMMEARTRLEMIGQRRRELLLMDRLNRSPPALPSFNLNQPPYATMAQNNNFATSDYQRDVSEEELDRLNRPPPSQPLLNLNQPPYAAATAQNNNFASSDYQRDMSEVELAFDIMKRVNPSMEPRRALALAKSYLKK